MGAWIEMRDKDADKRVQFQKSRALHGRVD